MTTIFSIPSYYYGSSDFLDPSTINNDIKTIAGQAYNTGNNVQQTLKSASMILNNTYAFLNVIHTNTTFGNGLTNAVANGIATNTSISLSGLCPNNGNSYQAANNVFYSANNSLNAVLSCGQTNPYYNPADAILKSTTKTLSNIFKSLFTLNQDKSSVTNNTNNTLNSILSSITNTNSCNDASKIQGLTNFKLFTLLGL